MTQPKILLFARADRVRDSMQQAVEYERIRVWSAETVPDALGLVLSEDFDGIVIDLHMRVVEDSCFLMAAIHHFQPGALIAAVSDSLTVQEAEGAIRLRADVIVRPSNIRQVAELVNKGVQGMNLITEEWVEEYCCRLA